MVVPIGNRPFRARFSSVVRITTEAGFRPALCPSTRLPYALFFLPDRDGSLRPRVRFLASAGARYLVVALFLDDLELDVFVVEIGAPKFGVGIRELIPAAGEELGDLL